MEKPQRAVEVFNKEFHHIIQFYFAVLCAFFSLCSSAVKKNLNAEEDLNTESRKDKSQRVAEVFNKDISSYYSILLCGSLRILCVPLRLKKILNAESRKGKNRRGPRRCF